MNDISFILPTPLVRGLSEGCLYRTLHLATCSLIKINCKFVSMADLSIIIVCYKGWDRLHKCLDALNSFTGSNISIGSW